MSSFCRAIIVYRISIILSIPASHAHMHLREVEERLTSAPVPMGFTLLTSLLPSC
jgi:hypothetical protein